MVSAGKAIEAGTAEADRDLTLAKVQEFCTIAERTGNPLFLWKALSAWFDADRLHQRLGHEPMAMAQQFRTYLAIVAKRLSDLSEGLDYRQTPQPFGTLARVPASMEIARKRAQTLTAAQATKLALHALELKRPGWNAFGRSMALAEQDIDALTHELYRTIGNMGDGASIEALLDDHALDGPRRGRAVLTDARALRKRIKASRDARISK